MRDRALFDFAMDSKLRGCDLVRSAAPPQVRPQRGHRWTRSIERRLQPDAQQSRECVISKCRCGPSPMEPILDVRVRLAISRNRTVRTVLGSD